MYEELKEIKDNNRVGDFLFPELPVKGKVTILTIDTVVIESQTDGQTYQYITHPDNVVIVQRK
jgi:hypothetical protein